MRLLERLAELRSGDGRGVLFTVVEGEGAGAKALAVEGADPIGDGVPAWALEQFDELVRRGRNRLLEADGVKVFAEWYGPPPRLVVYGAVDTAESLCRGAKLLGWTAIVADARGMFLTPERMPSADRLIAAWPKEALAEIAPDHQTAVVVLTHDDKFDEPALMAALESEAFYVGALGSRRTTGAPPRAPARGGCRRGRSRSDHGAVRARHRRGHAGGDRALDPRGDPRGAGRPLGRAAPRLEAPHPRREVVREGRGSAAPSPPSADSTEGVASAAPIGSALAAEVGAARSGPAGSCPGGVRARLATPDPVGWRAVGAPPRSSSSDPRCPSAPRRGLGSLRDP